MKTWDVTSSLDSDRCPRDLAVLYKKGRGSLLTFIILLCSFVKGTTKTRSRILIARSQGCLLVDMKDADQHQRFFLAFILKACFFTLCHLIFILLSGKRFF